MCKLLFEFLKNGKFAAQQPTATRADRQFLATLPDLRLPAVIVAQTEIIIVVEVEPSCLGKMVGSKGAQLLLCDALLQLRVDCFL